MSFDEAVEAIQGAGGIKAVAEASEEAFLDRNPVARFVLETYPQGAAEIQASDLFAAWERWCVGVKAGFGEKPVTGTRHDPGTRTSFGRKVKKLEGLVSRTREGDKCVLVSDRTI
jgi:phage/plasmid-associated DNA primase